MRINWLTDGCVTISLVAAGSAYFTVMGFLGQIHLLLCLGEVLIDKYVLKLRYVNMKEKVEIKKPVRDKFSHFQGLSG